ncbi:hypothetical protein [Modicisalibacter xianhensis]|uniref:hypothetical protein n=1 Tax=Modicisalibacter xianhensis TaxID=442341 RepID=UPI0011600F47|nr:hypothetical protein [Halomonas xianhensis]
MKATKAIALLSTVATLSLSAIIALADRPAENIAGQSAQLEHVLQDKREPLSNRDASNAEVGSDMDAVEAYRQSNLLGQSDALSKTKPYASLSLINLAVDKKSGINKKQQNYEATNHSSSRDNRRDW